MGDSLISEKEGVLSLEKIDGGQDIIWIIKFFSFR
jgi:hypothetical protein